MGTETFRDATVRDNQKTGEFQNTSSESKSIWAWAILISILATWSSGLVIYSAGAGAEFARVTPYAFLILAALIAVAIAATSLAAALIGSLLKVGRALSLAAFWVASYLSLTATALPLPQGVGMTVLADYGTSWTNLAVSAALATLATLLLGTKARIVPIAALVAILISTSAPLAYELYRYRAAARGAHPVLSGSGDILVLSFDGIQLDVFRKAIEQEPDLVNRLRNFRHFDNVIASSPATLASLTGIVAGNRNFKAEAQTNDDLIALARAKGVTNRLAEAGHLVRGYGPYSQVMLPGFDMTPSLVRGDPTAEFAYLLQVLASRHVGPQIATSDFLSRGASAFARRMPLERPTFEKSIGAQVDRGHGPDWDRSLLKTWDDLVTYRESLQVRRVARAAHFLHFAFTHHPVDFDSDCKFRSENKEWHDANQTYSGLVGEAVCAIRSMEAILARLDEIGAFDDNLVVIMSDHGAPVQWNDPATIEGMKIRGNDHWGFGRYRPVLMVKLPGERRESMEHDTRPAILDDLALSICVWARLGDCSQYEGMNLFDPNGTPPDGYFINIVADATATFSFETHETIRLNRTVDPMRELDRYLSSSAQQ